MGNVIHKLQMSDSRSVSAIHSRGSTENRLAELAAKCLSDYEKHHNLVGGFKTTVLDVTGVSQNGFHVFRAQSSEADLVFKLDMNEGGSAKFDREILNQQRLFETYEPHKGLNVPAVRFVSQKLRYFVMDHVVGSGIQYAVRNHICAKDEDAIFYQAGRWLKVLHGLRAMETQPFDPSDRAVQLNTRLKSNRAKAGIYQHKKLQDFAKVMTESIPDYMGLPNPVVLGHGDFHGDNLIFNGNTCTGIDFYNVKRLSAGSDIARILVHADLAQYESADLIGSLGLVQSHQDAFFDGYGFDLPEKHPFCYLIRQRILEAWSKTALPSSGKGPQMELLIRLEMRANIAFS